MSDIINDLRAMSETELFAKAAHKIERQESLITGGRIRQLRQSKELVKLRKRVSELEGQV